jgi:hypothetical protein
VSGRDAFVGALAGHLGGLPVAATLETLEVDGHAGALLRVGLPERVAVRVGILP